MNQKYIPDEHSLKIILAQYAIVDFSYKQSSSDLENTTIFIFAKNQNYVLRVCGADSITAAQIQTEVDFLTFLNENNFPTAEIYSNIDGKFLSKVEIKNQVWQVILMAKIYGVEIPENDWIKTGDLLENMAQTQATLHHLGTEFAQISLQNDYELEVADSKIGRLLNKKLIELQKLQDLPADLLEIITNIKSLEFKYSAFLPLGFIHDDFNWHNLLLDDENILNVIDFRSLRVGPILSCLGSGLFEAILSAFELGLDLDMYSKKYLDFYSQIRELDQIELNELLKPIILTLDLRLASELCDAKQINSKIQNFVILKNELLKLSFS